jgi:hypothetical protein
MSHSMNTYVQVIWPQLAGSKCFIPFWPELLGRQSCTRSQLAGTYFILPFSSMLIGRHTCTSDMNKLGRNLMDHSLRQTYLYKWFDPTWQEHNVSFHSDLFSWTDILVQLIRSHFTETNCIIPFWLMLIGIDTCISDLKTLGRNLMYYSFLTNAVRKQSNLNKSPRQIVQLIRSHLAGT